MAKNRPISTIAYEIKANWKPVNFAAKPYLEAMYDLHSMSDKYIMDSASSILAGFLSNASSWRGEVAKKIKKELTDMIKGKDTITESSTEQLRQEQAERDLQIADKSYKANPHKTPHAGVLDTELGPMFIAIVNGQYNIGKSRSSTTSGLVFRGDRAAAKKFLAKNYIEGNLYEGSFDDKEQKIRLGAAEDDLKIVDKQDSIAVSDTVNGTIGVEKTHGRYVITKLGMSPKILFSGDRFGARKFLATQYVVDMQEEGSDLDKTEAQKTKEKQQDDLDRIKDKQAYDLEKAREKDFKKKQQEREADRREKDVEKKTDAMKKESIDEAFEKLDFK